MVAKNYCLSNPVIFSDHDCDVQSPPKRIVFRFHHHSRKVIGSLGHSRIPWFRQIGLDFSSIFDRVQNSDYFEFKHPEASKCMEKTWHGLLLSTFSPTQKTYKASNMQICLERFLFQAFLHIPSISHRWICEKCLAAKAYVAAAITELCFWHVGKPRDGLGVAGNLGHVHRFHSCRLRRCLFKKQGGDWEP